MFSQQQGVSRMAEKSSGERDMHSSVSPRDALSKLVQPQAFDTREHWLDAVARKAGISYRAAKGIFYGEITDPEHRAFRRVTDKINGAEHEATMRESAAIQRRSRDLAAELDELSARIADIRRELGIDRTS
jgi:hypothetical protein